MRYTACMLPIMLLLFACNLKTQSRRKESVIHGRVDRVSEYRLNRSVSLGQIVFVSGMAIDLGLCDVSVAVGDTVEIGVIDLGNWQSYEIDKINGYEVMK